MKIFTGLILFIVLIYTPTFSEGKRKKNDKS